MTAWKRSLGTLALALLFSAPLGACGPYDPGGEQSQECGQDEASTIFQAAGFEVDDLSLIEGCSYAVQGGVRQGETRNAAARVNPDHVSAVLGKAHVPVAEASPARDQDTGPWLLSSDSDILTTPRGQEWHEGQGLVFKDSLDVDGRTLKRYVSWGKEQDSDDYLIRVVLDVGSM